MSAAGKSESIDPEKILQQLSGLWKDLAKQKDGQAGVLRACSMTLIAAVDEADDPAKVGETIAMLMREHPSRAIVVRVRDSQENLLAEQVLAQCWMPFQEKQQICCEQVEITSSLKSLEDLPPVLLPLVVADLPVVLWVKSKARMDTLAGIAGKLVVDSEVMGGFGPVEQLGEKHRVGDLAWVRLTRWRESIAQIFENKCYQAELPGLDRARITFTGERPTTSDFYMGAWLDRKETFWERGEARAVALESAAGEVHTRIQETGGGGVDVSVHGLLSHTVFVEPTDYILLREELSITGRDPVFEAVLPRATRLAEHYT